MTLSKGSKFVAMIFSFITDTEIAISWVLEFVEWTIHENHKNWYPYKH